MNIVTIWCSCLLWLLRACSCNETEIVIRNESMSILNLNTGHTVDFHSTNVTSTASTFVKGIETQDLLPEDFPHGSFLGGDTEIQDLFPEDFPHGSFLGGETEIQDLLPEDFPHGSFLGGDTEIQDLLPADFPHGTFPGEVIPAPKFVWDQSEQKTLIEATLLMCGINYLCLKHPSQITSCGYFGYICSSCKCDSSCHRYGDCCVDILDQNAPIKPNDQIDYTSCEEPKWTTFANDITAIVMISYCPLGRTLEDDVVTKCEQPDITVKTQATPVSCLQTLKTYRNKFCAKCHEIDNYTEWTHGVSCKDARPFNNISSTADLWRAILTPNCDVVSYPPDSVPVHRCSPSTINSCNAKGGWRNPENYSHLVAFCQLYNHPVVYYGNKYKNIFCAFCNGAEFEPNEYIPCNPPPILPFPLSILLSFDPPQAADREAVEQGPCDHGQVFDPFTEKCTEIKCQPRHVFRDGRCEFIFNSTRGLGFEVPVVLTTNDGGTLSLTYEKIGLAYKTAMNDISGHFRNFLIHQLQMSRLIMPDKQNISNQGFFAKVSVVSIIDISLNMFGKYFHAIQEMNFPVLDSRGETQTWLSTGSTCPDPSSPISNISVNVITFDDISDFNELYVCDETDHSCLSDVSYGPIMIQPDCPFVEFNLSLSKFIFDFVSHNLTLDNFTLSVDPSRVYLCGEVLRMCSDVLEEISLFFHQTVPELVLPDVQTNDPVLAIFSLVCLSLSLLGLLLTFIVYAILPELRTLPGKITMLLTLHLFAAQLLFLVGNNRSYNAILCQVMGILIHYFWLTSFMWMMSAALHMYRLFTNMWMTRRAVKSYAATRTIVRYCIICHAVPMVCVGTCSVTYYSIGSQSLHIGYGGNVCFIRGLVGVGVFFVGPLLFMLLFNLFCFVQTVRVFRSVPDMANSSNVENRTFLFAYLKLSILLGFSWLFGLLHSAFQLEVVEYIFVFLTGSQGLLIFVSFCLMRRSLKMLKGRLCPCGKKLDSGMPSTKSSD